MRLNRELACLNMEIIRLEKVGHGNSKLSCEAGLASSVSLPRGCELL
jgi:hypothetical protein